MPGQRPVGTCQVKIPDLGTAKGFVFDNGVRQVCGIPYASLAKRWTRSELQTSWPNSSHDGTVLGPSCPHPGILQGGEDVLTPVPIFQHSSEPKVDELNGLVLNIVLPPESICSTNQKGLPIFVYVHGGSLLYGGANLAIFDSVNLVSHSLEIGRPIIAINFNYRVGIGGFLAGRQVKESLKADGFAGSGNFGFTDQQVAFEWVQKYCRHLGGDIGNVTVCGESAGGISISNQLCFREQLSFHRAICMSGLSASIPPWTMSEHDKYFEAICRHFKIDPASNTALDQLRQVPQIDLADQTPAIQGVASGTGNPCLDGWFYDSSTNPIATNAAPSYLKSFMFGDVYHEGVIFHLNILEDTYEDWFRLIDAEIADSAMTRQFLELYDITPDTPRDLLISRFEHMAGDAVFKIPNFQLARSNHKLASQGQLFLYHFDQRSRLQNELNGTAYHAHELLFLFNNLHEHFNEREVKMGRDFATAWIEFAYGSEPWTPALTPNGEYVWKVWGPDCSQSERTEAEDEQTRDYARMQKVLNIGEPGVTWLRWLRGIDAIVNKRENMGKGVS